MELKQILLILNKLIEFDDIETINQLNYWFKYLLDSHIDCFYYYEDIGEGLEYFSNIEFELVEYNEISMPIGYSIDIIANILIDSKKYDIKDLKAISDIGMLKLFKTVSNDLLENNNSINAIIRLLNDIELLEFVKTNIKEFLKELTLRQLNQILKAYYSYYAKINIETDIITLNDKYISIITDIINKPYLKTDLTINSLTAYLNNFIDSIEYMEDIEVLIDIINEY